ncbi:hypothetical protein, partial [Mycobacterium hackensackense]|uniref:hypothetical protein n=1 Tax=Mycobacterium hackensackense TaxID=228909 RepID=UPI002265BC8C
TGIQKNSHPPNSGRRESPQKRVAKKQQTKTTKHTIEFSNNTPDFARTAIPRLKAAVRPAGSE